MNVSNVKCFRAAAIGLIGVLGLLSSHQSYGQNSSRQRMNPYGEDILSLAVNPSSRTLVEISGGKRVGNVQPTDLLTPTIISFTPASGPIGTGITIKGTNFSTIPANNIVYFGAVRARVTSATSSTITTSVPAGASYAPISVTTNGLQALSNARFVPTSLRKRVLGSASFPGSVDLQAGPNPGDVVIADFDQDGKPDLAVINGQSASVSIFHNNSDSGIINQSSFAPRSDMSTRAWPIALAVGDINGDGALDLMVANNVSNSISVFENKSTPGSISFGPKAEISVGVLPRSLAVVDCDGDGRLDIVVVNGGSNSLSVIRNLGTGGVGATASFQPSFEIPTGKNPVSVAVGDLNQDAKADIVVCAYDADSIFIYQNLSEPGSLSWASFGNRIGLATGVQPVKVAVLDVHNDGKLDIVSVNYASSTISVFQNITNGGDIGVAHFPRRYDVSTFSMPYGLAVSSVDGDEKPDLTLTFQGVELASILLNTASIEPNNSILFSGIRFEISSVNGVPVSGRGGVVLGDLDGDGAPDLVLCDQVSNKLVILKQATVPSAVGLVFPSNTQSWVTIRPTLAWSAVIGATSYHLQISKDSIFALISFEDTTLTGTSRQLASLLSGTTYHWRVRGKNEGGYGPFSPVWSFTTVPVYPQIFELNTTLAFPQKTSANQYNAMDYRLFGLPGSSDLLAKDIVTGVQNEDWEIVWDNGAATDYLKRYDGSNDFKFSTGKAFWVISKTPLSIARTVPSATLNAAQEVEIPVRSGWNLITNPYAMSVPWTRIQTTNGITGAIYSFNGAFNNATTFDPYAGYYFFNGTPSPVLTTLRVPFSSAFGKLTELEVKKENGWRVKIEVSTGSETLDGRRETECVVLEKVDR